MNLEETLTKKALAMPHRTYAAPSEREEDAVSELRRALNEMMQKELLNEKSFECRC